MYRQEDMLAAEQFVREINESTDRFVIHKESRPIVDIKQMLESSVELYGGNVAIWQKFKGKERYTGISYKELLADVNALGTALIAHGLKGKRIAVIGENSYYWAVSYLAAVCGTGIVVPLDKELDAAELRQLVENSETSCVLLAPKFRKTFEDMLADKVGCLEMLVEFEAEEGKPGVFTLNNMLAEGKKLIEGGDRRFLDAQIDPHAMSILLFTSGTTGIAKGVMLSHSNICADLMIAPNLLQVEPTDLFFSVLPIHHTYECTCGFLMPLYKGASIGYCEGLKYIKKNLKELNPTFILAVPLIFEALYKGIWKEVRKSGKEKLVKAVMKVNKLTSKVGLDLNRKLLKDIYAVFGNRMEVLISGGAAIRPEILQFFNDLGFIAVQGYGLTECAPMGALNPDRHDLMRNVSVGHVMPHCQAKIVDKGEDGVGEICIKGPNVMLGYYKMPEATAEVLQDGWFHTGDLGYLDEDDFIYITGRKKNVIITANGKNVYPEELEYYLGLCDYVSESMVWAENDERGQNIAIVATIKPDMAELEPLLEGVPEEQREAKVREIIQAEVDKINEPQPLFKRINRIVIKQDEFVKNTAHKIRRMAEGNKQ